MKQNAGISHCTIRPMAVRWYTHMYKDIVIQKAKIRNETNVENCAQLLACSSQNDTKILM